MCLNAAVFQPPGNFLKIREQGKLCLDRVPDNRRELFLRDADGNIAAAILLVPAVVPAFLFLSVTAVTKIGAAVPAPDDSGSEDLRMLFAVIPAGFQFGLILAAACLQNFSDLIEVAPADQRFVHIRQNTPLTLIRFIVVIRLSQIQRRRHPPKDKVAHIGRIHQYLFDNLLCPEAVGIARPIGLSAQIAELTGRRNSFFIQLTHDGARSGAAEKLCVDSLDNRCGLRIGFKPVLLCGRFPVSVGNHAGNVFTGQLFGMNCQRHLLGLVSGIEAVDQVFQRNQQAAGGAVRFKAVIAVNHGDKPDAHGGKDVLQQISRLNIISRKPAEILDDQRLDFSLPNVGEQPLKLRAVRVGSGPSVIHIGICQMKVRVLRYIVPADFNLSLNGIAVVVLFAVFNRESGVDSRLPDGRQHGTDRFLRLLRL